MSDIKIRVGAAFDSSLTTVFRSLAEASARAAKQVQSNAAGSARGMVQPYRTAGKQIQDGISETSAKAKQEADKMVRDVERSAKARVRAERDAMKEVERELAAHNRTQERMREQSTRAALRASARSAASQARFVGAQASGMGSAAASAGRRALGFGLRVAGDIASGAGIDTSLSSVVQKNISLETSATQLSNSGYMPSDKTGRNTSRVDPRELIKQAREVGAETAFDPNAIMQGLQAFVAKTGDLQGGRDALKDLAVLSKATGTNLQDMVSAAGDVSNQLGDIPDKGKVIDQVMRKVAAEGKTGAVEIADLATQMAKVAANAGRISGDRATNIGTLTALAQSSRGEGGSASASQAASSVMAFMATFQKGARLKAFKGYGVDVFDKNGDVLDPRGIIVNSLKAAASKSRGGLAHINENVAQMFATQQAQRVVLPYQKIYSQAYASTQGTEEQKTSAAVQAVNDEFDRLTKSTMEIEEVQESFRRQMATSESQAQLMNNKLSEVAEEAGKNLLPALVALTPAIVGGSQALASIIGALTGQGPANEQGAAVMADVHAFGDAAHLDTGIRAGKVSAADVAKAEADKATLDKAVDAQQRKVAQERAQQEDAGSFGTAAKQLAMGGVVGQVFKGRQDTAKREQFEKDSSELESMKQSQQRIDDSLRAIKGGVLNVRIVGGDLPRPTAPPAPVNAATGS